MRTFAVFLDAPVHVEYRLNDMPLISEGVKIGFKLGLKHPRDPKLIRNVDGEYEVKRRMLRYEPDKPGAPGLSQYLELALWTKSSR